MRDFVIKRRISCSDEKLFRIAPHLMAFMLELVPSAFKFIHNLVSSAFVLSLPLNGVLLVDSKDLFEPS